MSLAKMTSDGQITIPAEVRKALGVKAGDKILFIQEGDRIIMLNASVNALLEAQNEFEGIAESLGIKSEQDVVDMVKEVRRAKKDRHWIVF